jgi:hypothetical protein
VNRVVPVRVYGHFLATIGASGCSPKRFGDEASPMEQIEQLRKTAAWYRDLAAQAANPDIRDDRLRAAALLEREAAFTEQAFVSPAIKLRNWGVTPLDC